jgi:hypothetical protein
MERRLQRFTPKAVFDPYLLLANDDKREFLRLLGKVVA